MKQILLFSFANQPLVQCIFLHITLWKTFSYQINYYLHWVLELIPVPRIYDKYITINETYIVLIKLITSVKELDKTRSPFTNLAIAVEATPLWAATIIIKSMASGKG